MQLFIKSYDCVTHNVDEQETVSDLKVALANRDQLPLGSIQLYFESNNLDDSTLLTSLPASSTLDVIVPVLGGKVHGSLARAGKVKGQTPKVEKQEKKKKLTGRAKRRLQYNRRFVAVVSDAPGRRRGPNAQSVA